MLTITRMPNVEVSYALVGSKLTIRI